MHAVTEDGVLVVTSASGSQLGPYAAGAERAQGLSSIIGKTLVLEREYLGGRATVVLVREAIGC